MTINIIEYILDNNKISNIYSIIMGLTKEQWVMKRIKELTDIVNKKGKEIKKEIRYYCGKEPLIIKDICCDGIALVKDELVFADNSKHGFTIRKKANEVERKYLEEVLSDLK